MNTSTENVLRARNALRSWERTLTTYATAADDLSSGAREALRCRYLRERSAARDALRIAEGLHASAAAPSGRVYYVTAVRGDSWVAVAGPYTDHETALRAVPATREELKRRGYDLLRVSLGTTGAPAGECVETVLS